MRAWSLSGVCGRLLVALALTVPGPLGSIAGGFGGVAQAQDVSPPPGEQAHWTEKRVPTVTICTSACTPRPAPVGDFFSGIPTSFFSRPMTAPNVYTPRMLCEPGAVGDCWLPGDLERMFGR